MNNIQKFLFFILGFIVGGIMLSQSATVKTVTVEKTPEAWVELKEIDDESFGLASALMNYCSQGYDALLDKDVDAANKIAAEMNKVTGQLEKNVAGRAAVLKKLGY